MVMNTNAGYGDKGNMVKQAVGLFATHTARNTTIVGLSAALGVGISQAADAQACRATGTRHGNHCIAMLCACQGKGWNRRGRVNCKLNCRPLPR